MRNVTISRRKPYFLAASVLIIPSVVLSGPADSGANIRVGSKYSIVSVQKGLRAQGATRSSRGEQTFPYPRPRLVGFSPLIAMATSDEGRPLGADLEFEHELQSTYVGSSLIPGTDPDYIVGFLDSGSDVNLAAGVSANIMGLYFPNTVGNFIPIGGVGDETVLAEITMPVGWFAQGLAAFNASGELDFTSLVGHSNVCGLVAPPIVCDNGETLTAVMGMPFIAFHTSVISVDTPRKVEVGGVRYASPDVQIQDPFDPIPNYPRRFSMDLRGLSVAATTANYFPNFEDLETPEFPTLLSLFAGSIPTGGSYFATVRLFEVDPSDGFETEIEVEMLVDTGAQSSIISSAVAADLSLPIEPDFTVSVCGVGGFVADVPGYYIDTVRIGATGGALRYSRAPVVVIDLPSPAGGILEGILGMNFFWDRNIIFQPDLLGVSLFHVSDPIPFAFGDFDADRDVDGDDAGWFMYCATDPFFDAVAPECDQLDGDNDFDVDLADYALFQRCYSGANVIADAGCVP